MPSEKIPQINLECRECKKILKIGKTFIGTDLYYAFFAKTYKVDGFSHSYICPQCLEKYENK